ncbi:PH domain-containing protein [Haloarchaeobius sp. TZWWS8]|uniref:PH domain-containing protein n=1 Tax=Haloarchaeobius sp. TZWWS8 TaxID=3446121 RepID=UPI003EBFF5C6
MEGNTHPQSADESERNGGLGSDVVYETTPTTKMVVIYAAILAVGGFGLGGYFLANPQALGEQGYGEIAGWVVLLLSVIGLVRLVVQYFVLRRTNYIITRDSLRREYELFYSEQSRELPLSKVRGIELRRGRLQSALGFGSVSFLAAGTNRSIGYIDFSNTAEPHDVRDIVLEQLDEASDGDLDGFVAGREHESKSPAVDPSPSTQAGAGAAEVDAK